MEQSCTGCHNDRAKAGGLSLQGYQVARAADALDVTEKMIRKVRAGQMPPAGGRRPAEAALDGLASALEAAADARAAQVATPGRRSFQRLNRAEYAQSVRDLVGLDVNAGDYLPLDTKMANFDNIADAQLLSPSVMQSYLTAAAEISRLAVGDPTATAREVSFLIPRTASQREQVEGAPFGTRGGLSLSTRSRPTAPTVSACRSITRPPARCTATAAPRCTPPRRRSRSRSRSTVNAWRCSTWTGG